MERADCIVAAAGRSTRMGEWKLLLPFRGSTIIQAAVDAALPVSRRVLLVTGHRAAELARLFAGTPRVVIVENPDWQLGMFSSIQRAARDVDTDRFFITLGDKPLVTADVYRALLAVEPADAVFAAFGGMKGHPVLCGPRVREAILKADPASGSMKELVSRLVVREVPWRDDSVLADIDTPEQYMALSRIQLNDLNG